MDLETGLSTRRTESPGQAPLGKGSSAKAPERVVWEANPAPAAYLGLYIAGVVLIPVIIGIPILIWAVLDRKNCVYQITTRRATRKEGIIGKRYTEVDLADVRHVLLRVGIIDRLFGIGTVGISTAGSSGVEVIFSGVENPVHVRDLIMTGKADQLAQGQATSE